MIAERVLARRIGCVASARSISAETNPNHLIDEILGNDLQLLIDHGADQATCYPSSVPAHLAPHERALPPHLGVVCFAQ